MTEIRLEQGLPSQLRLKGEDLQLNQSALRLGGPDEGREQRMGREGPGFQLRMVLHADEPGMPRDFDDLGQDAVRRHPGEAQSDLLQTVLVVDVDFVAMAVALADDVGAIDL